MGSEDITLQASEDTEPGGERRPAARFERLGRFVVLERLGAGGAGSVHRAYDPQLDRAVAIKLLHASESTQRLLAEARAMARLRHPNVATIHDVGEADGRVWLAMEFVEGGTLRQWLDAEPRSEADILRVFRRAGAGLAAAHHEGLVHRDFKPENVLMHGSGRPAVTDFGLAALDERATTPSEGTGAIEQAVTHPIAGTPAYMSPEQFNGGVVGAASDQYAFGVALFEAICRRRPFEGESVPELCHRVTEGVFEFPSDVRVRPWLRAALERMLAKDASDRFPSMDAALQALDREPVVRRRRLFTMGALAVASVGTMAAMSQRDTGPRCDAGLATVEEVWSPKRRSAIEEALVQRDVQVAPAAMPRVYETLDGWAATWAEGYDDACRATHVDGTQSLQRLDARMRCFEGQLEHLASLTEEIEVGDADVLRKAFDASMKLPPVSACEDPSHVEPTRAERVAAQALTRARVRNDLGEYASGLEAVEEGLEALGDGASSQRVWLLATRGQLARRSGDNALAEESLRDAVRANALAPDPRGVASAWLELAMLIGDTLAQAERVDGVLLAAEAAVMALDDSEMERRLFMTRGSILVQAGRLEEGLAAIERAISMSQTDDAARAVVLGNYGNALFEAGRYDDALAAFEQAYAIERELLPSGHPAFVLSHQNRSRALNELGRNDEAVELLAAAIEAGEEAFGPSSPRLGGPHLNLGVALMDQQHYADARAHIERAAELWTDAYPDEHRYFDIVDINLGIIASEQGRREEALAHYRAAKDRAIEREGANTTVVATILGNEANALSAMGRYEEAAALQRQSLSIRESFEGPEHPALGYALTGLARSLIAMGSYAEAVEAARRARRIREGKVSPAVMYQTYITLADALAHQGTLDEARRWADAAASAFEETKLPASSAVELIAFEKTFGRTG